MKIARKERGTSLFQVVFWIAVVAGIVWFFASNRTDTTAQANSAPVVQTDTKGKVGQSSISIAPTDTSAKAHAKPVAELEKIEVTSPKEEGFWAGLFVAGGLLAGGWFVASGAGWLATCILYALLIIPALAIAILSEQGDPRVALFRERERENDASSHEILVSAICVATLFVLNWGGIPIWATFMSWSLFSQIGAVVLYAVLGILWGFKRWDDFARYLHEKRGEKIKEIVDNVRNDLISMQEVRAKLRTTLKLNPDTPLPSTPKELDTFDTDRDGRDLFGQHADKMREFYASYLGEDRDNNSRFSKASEISDAVISQWLSELTCEEKKVAYPEEFTVYVTKRTKVLKAVSAGDYKGQIYLWSVFWPWSIAYRVVRKIITLRFLRDFFMFIFRHLRVFYDWISNRHEVRVEAVKRAPMAGDAPKDA